MDLIRLSISSSEDAARGWEPLRVLMNKIRGLTAYLWRGPTGDRARLTRSSVIAAFFAILFLPGSLMLLTHRPIAPVPENRRLAGWPAYSTQKGMFKYIEAAQAWFNDHFGFRDVFIRLNSQIDYSLFDYSSRIHIGKDGWLFYRNVYDIQRPGIEDLLSRYEDRIVAGTIELNRILAKRGIALILAIPPLKGHFYSAYFPKSLQPLPKPTRISQLFEHLRHSNGLLFVDIDKLLNETAKQRPVFHKTDFHWNDPAAFVVAKWIVDELSRRANRKSSVWTHELKITRKDFSGGQATFMPLFSPPHEIGLFVEPTWGAPPAKIRTDVAPYDFVTYASKPAASVLPPIAVLGDSFFDGMIRSGIGVEFEKVYHASWAKVRLPEFLASIPPDCRYVIVEFIEVGVAGFSDLADIAPRK